MDDMPERVWILLFSTEVFMFLVLPDSLITEQSLCTCLGLSCASLDNLEILWRSHASNLVDSASKFVSRNFIKVSGLRLEQVYLNWS